MMPTRRRRPTLERLESRLQPTALFLHPAVYPQHTAGPIPAGSRLAAPGEVLAAATYAAPSWTASGVAMDLIGGAALVGVSTGQDNISTVHYSVSGGALASQAWNPTTGNVTPTRGSTHTFAQGHEVAGDNWTCYWDQNPGKRTITLNVTLSDGQQFTGSDDYNVFQIMAQSFQVTVPGATAGAYPNSTLWGIYNGAGTAYGGVTYVGTFVGTPGVGGFVQLVNIYTLRTGTQADARGNYTVPYRAAVAMPAGMFALDAPKAGQTAYYPGPKGGYSVPLDPNGTTQVGSAPQWWWGMMGGQQAPTDTPGMTLTLPGTRMPDGSPSSFTTHVEYRYSFKTYLDWASPAGIHFATAEADWTVSASATYTPPPGSFPTAAFYHDPANWQVSQTVTGPTTSMGIQIENWTMNVDDAKQKYAS
jgi:hypothetical protein